MNWITSQASQGLCPVQVVLLGRRAEGAAAATMRPRQGAVQLGVDVVGEAFPHSSHLLALPDAGLAVLIDVVHLNRLDLVLGPRAGDDAGLGVYQVLPVQHELTEGVVMGVVQVDVPLEYVLGRQTDGQLRAKGVVPLSLVVIIGCTLFSMPGMVGPSGLYVAHSCRPSLRVATYNVISGALSILNKSGCSGYDDSLSLM